MNMQETPTNEEALHEDDDLSCADLVSDAVAGEPGILNIDVDTASEQVAFDYDPSRVSEHDLERIALEIGPTLHERWRTCTVRVSDRRCEACAQRLEQRLSTLPGVRRASASFVSGMVSVQYDTAQIDPDSITHTVQTWGYRTAPELAPAEPEAAGLWPRVAALFEDDRVEMALTVVTFVGMMTGLGAEWLGAETLALVMYVIAYAAGSVFGLQAGLASLRELTIDVDLLMILAAIGAAIIGAPFEGAMLLFLFSLSNVLQNFAMDRTRNAIRALMKLRPNEALVRRGGRTAVLPLEQVVVSDRIIIRPGERVPLDGVIIEGESAVDQSPITGESVPVGKAAGDTVLAGTINQNGSLEVKVTRLAGDSTIAKLIRMVEEAQSEKANTQRAIDRFEQGYAIVVVVGTVLAWLIPMLVFGQSFDESFYRAITMMVAASPCALVISTPATILSAIGNGARRGVLFKGGIHMEQAATIKVIAFDKTGTLTEGKPRVTDVATLNGHSREAVLQLAASVEAKSEHPLARAIVEAARREDLALDEVTAFMAETGQGVRGTVNGERVYIGRLAGLRAFTVTGSPEATETVERLQNEGKTAMVLATLDEARGTAHLAGVVAVADTLRADARDVVADLKRLGIERVVMLTGDNRTVAEAIAAEAGVDEVFAELMPEDKVKIVSELKHNYGPVAMIGDGVNDAPALATATLGVAMGAAGTDVALETADVVLMADDLQNIPYFIALSRAARRTLFVNLGFALAVIAALVLSVWTIALPLPLGVIGHEGSTVVVSLNGLRLLGYRRS